MEIRWLTALHDDPKADAQAPHTTKFFSTLDEGRVDWEEGEQIIPNLSIALQWDVCRVCRAMLWDWEELHGCWLAYNACHFSTNNEELEKIITIVGATIPGESRKTTSGNAVESEDDSSIRYPIEMLNTISHRWSLSDHMRITETGFIVMNLCN